MPNQWQEMGLELQGICQTAHFQARRDQVGSSLKRARLQTSDFRKGRCYHLPGLLLTKLLLLCRPGASLPRALGPGWSAPVSQGHRFPYLAARESDGTDPPGKAVGIVALPRQMFL
ncbi:Motile Sperm Domain-Containing Protein 2 [Manis pentadactyla]|nr:Motile Sperm Domain-Containing Protein 2 [Manis pentadactyla]